MRERKLKRYKDMVHELGDELKKYKALYGDTLSSAAPTPGDAQGGGNNLFQRGTMMDAGGTGMTGDAGGGGTRSPADDQVDVETYQKREKEIVELKKKVVDALQEKEDGLFQAFEEKEQLR